MEKLSNCEACEKDIKFNSKPSLLYSAAHVKKNINCRTNKDLTDRKHVFDEPNFSQKYNIVEEGITDCIQTFHRYEDKCEYKVNLSEEKMVKKKKHILD